MITEQEIRPLLADIENARIERTISIDNTDKFGQTICAFANDVANTNQPGYLFIGAYDDGRLSGLKVTDKLLLNLAGLRQDGNILPQPALMVYKVSLPDSDVAVVEVQPSKLTPIRFKGNIWIRVGAQKAIANEEEERILMERRLTSNPTFDTCPCLEATIDDLDLNLFRYEYLPKAVDHELLQNDRRDVKYQLASLRLFDLANNCPTYAGILLVGKKPKYFLFGAYIQYVKFGSTTRGGKVLKENEFSGNLISMLKDLDAFAKYTIQNKRPVLVTALREDIVINYPYEAIRELLMNAVMHRSWESNAPVKFYEYTDRIEIDNPGNLYGKARPENFPNENDYRNPIIAEAMKILGYVNRFSRGVNMVQEALRENKSEPAKFEFKDITTFKVIVYNADPQGNVADDVADENGLRSAVTSNAADDAAVRVTDNVTDDAAVRLTEIQQRIIQLIRIEQDLSATRMAELCKADRRTIQRNLDKMKASGIIRRIGNSKSGYWEVITNN